MPPKKVAPRAGGHCPCRPKIALALAVVVVLVAAVAGASPYKEEHYAEYSKEPTSYGYKASYGQDYDYGHDEPDYEYEAHKPAKYKHRDTSYMPNDNHYGSSYGYKYSKKSHKPSYGSYQEEYKSYDKPYGYDAYNTVGGGYEGSSYESREDPYGHGSTYGHEYSTKSYTHEPSSYGGHYEEDDYGHDEYKPTGYKADTYDSKMPSYRHKRAITIQRASPFRITIPPLEQAFAQLQKILQERKKRKFQEILDMLEGMNGTLAALNPLQKHNREEQTLNNAIPVQSHPLLQKLQTQFEEIMGMFHGLVDTDREGQQSLPRGPGGQSFDFSELGLTEEQVEKVMVGVNPQSAREEQSVLATLFVLAVLGFIP